MLDEYQIRLTHKDTITKQNQLLNLVRKKISANVGLSLDEKNTFSILVADSLLSHGDRRCYYITDNSTKINLGSVHTLSLKMLDVNGGKVTLFDRRTNKRIVIETKELWKILKSEYIRAFPFALEEAIHMSREIPKREEATTYTFSSKKKMD